MNDQANMDYQKLLKFRNTHNLFAAQLGVFLEEIGPGYARTSMTVRADEVNPAGGVHGGCYFTMADAASAAAAASRGHQAVTLSANYNFLRSARVGERITAEAQEAKNGRSVCVYEVRLKDEAGALLGNGTFTFYILKKKGDVELAASP